MGFAESFIKSYQAGTQARAQRERTESEKEEIRQRAERAKLEAKRWDAELKLREMDASNNATRTAIDVASRTNAPTIPVAEAAGGVGPPAPAPRPQLPVQIPGQPTMMVEPAFADDLAAQRRTEADVNAARVEDNQNVDVGAIMPLLEKMIGPQAAAAVGGGGKVDPRILQLISTFDAQRQANTRDANTAPQTPIAVPTGDGQVTYMDPSQVVGKTFATKDPGAVKQATADLKVLGEMPAKLVRANSLVKALERARDAHAKLAAAGPIVGRLTPGTSAAAQQLKKARADILTKNNPLKGQGAVSDFERKLSDSTVPDDSVDHDVAAIEYGNMIEEAKAAVEADQALLEEARQRRSSRGVTVSPGAAPRLGGPPKNAAEYLASLGAQ